MGGAQSREVAKDQEDARRHRAPIDIVVQRPRLAERAGKPVLNVPNSTYRILYIDPAQRLDVVPRHGFIALRTDGYKADDPDHNDLAAALPGRRRSSVQSAASELVPTKSVN